MGIISGTITVDGVERQVTGSLDDIGTPPAPPPTENPSPFVGAEEQLFAFSMFNDQGNIKGWFHNPSFSGGAAPLISAINGPHQVTTPGAPVLPFGPDATTGFLGGAKIGNDGGAHVMIVVFDTVDIDPNKQGCFAVLGHNSTNQSLNAKADTKLLNINGETKRRLIVSLYKNVQAGPEPAQFDIVNELGWGQLVTFTVHGYLPPYV